MSLEHFFFFFMLHEVVAAEKARKDERNWKENMKN